MLSDSRIIIVIYRIDCLTRQPPNVLARPIGWVTLELRSGGWGGWEGGRQRNDSQPKAHRAAFLSSTNSN